MIYEINMTRTVDKMTKTTVDYKRNCRNFGSENFMVKELCL